MLAASRTDARPKSGSISAQDRTAWWPSAPVTAIRKRRRSLRRVESKAGLAVGQDIVQQRSCEAMALDSAGGALKAHLHPVLGPGEQVGHRQPGLPREVADQGYLCHRIGGRKGMTHGLPPPGCRYPDSGPV